MKLDEVQKMSRMNWPRTEEGYRQMQEYLRNQGIDPSNVYQELEMSSHDVNTHRDTSYTNAMVNLHSHSYTEIIYCRTADHVEYLVESERYRICAGDILFIPPGVSHRPILAEHMNVPYERDVIWISQSFMERAMDLLRGENEETLDYQTPIRTANTKWEFLEELFRRGVIEEEEKRTGWDAVVVGNTLTILAYMQRAYQERSANPMKAEKPELLDRITAYIEENYQEHITVDDLAKKFYVSNSTISHQFKQKMGVSLYRYITQRRLIAAKTLILQGVLLENVARSTGFVDYSTFYRAFKQEYGISPRQFTQL